MSSVFDDIAAIAKAQTDAYHVAYETGYKEGYRAAMVKAKEMVAETFPQKPSEKK